MRRPLAPPFDRLRVVSKALRGPQGHEPVELVEPQAQAEGSSRRSRRGSDPLESEFIEESYQTVSLTMSGKSDSETKPLR